jgi:hypothetical protein
MLKFTSRIDATTGEKNDRNVAATDATHGRTVTVTDCAKALKTPAPDGVQDRKTTAITAERAARTPSAKDRLTGTDLFKVTMKVITAIAVSAADTNK